jgi:sRNA-binding protein
MMSSRDLYGKIGKSSRLKLIGRVVGTKTLPKWNHREPQITRKNQKKTTKKNKKTKTTKQQKKTTTHNKKLPKNKKKKQIKKTIAVNCARGRSSARYTFAIRPDRRV